MFFNAVALSLRRRFRFQGFVVGIGKNKVLYSGSLKGSVVLQVSRCLTGRCVFDSSQPARGCSTDSPDLNRL